MLRELFGKDDFEKKIETNEKKIRELQAKIAELDRETGEIFEQLEVSPEQIQQFLGNKDNFTVNQWEEVQCQMAELEKKVSMQRDISQVRRTYDERSKIQRSWLFVR